MKMKMSKGRKATNQLSKANQYSTAETGVRETIMADDGEWRLAQWL
jgi:hypothetical protein